jgi:hypothetical protein
MLEVELSRQRNDVAGFPGAFLIGMASLPILVSIDGTSAYWASKIMVWSTLISILARTFSGVLLASQQSDIAGLAGWSFAR